MHVFMKLFNLGLKSPAVRCCGWTKTILKGYRKASKFTAFFYQYQSISCPGPGCSKLTTSLVNMSLKFQTLISQKCQYFLLKKCEKLLQCKSFSHFFNKKYQYYWL